MKRSELKSGMMLEFTNSSIKRLVLLDTEKGDTTCDLNLDIYQTGGFRHGNYFDLINWNEDLTAAEKNSALGDIIKVYSMYGELIWERNPIVPEYNMEEAIKLVGHNFKIKK